MKIEYLHASKFGNAVAVAVEFKEQMAQKGAVVDVHHIREVRPTSLASYAILTTEAAPKPNKTTGRMPTEEELAKWQRVRPIMNEILQGKGLVNVAEDKVHVTGLKRPLEEGWQKKVEAFVARIPDSIAERPEGRDRAPASAGASARASAA